MGKLSAGSLLKCSASLMVTLTMLSPAPALAGGPLAELAQRAGIRVIAEATSSSDVRDRSIRQIPYRRMTREGQRRAAILLDDVSQYRRMPCLQYEVDPEVFQYLVSHPDVAVSTWRVMGISKLEMWQTGQFEYEATGNDGSEGIADVLCRDRNQCLFIVNGSYRSPLLPATIDASALVWLRYRFVTGTDGKTYVNQQVETFIHFPSGAIDAIARLASGVTNTILDRNVFEVSLYARMMSQAAHSEPEWIEQLAERMDGVMPQRRTELAAIAQARRTSEAAPADSPPSNLVSRPLQDDGQGTLRQASVSRPIPLPPVLPETEDEDAVQLADVWLEETSPNDDDDVPTLQSDDAVSTGGDAKASSSAEGRIAAPERTRPAVDRLQDSQGITGESRRESTEHSAPRSIVASQPTRRPPHPGQLAK